MEEDDEGDGQVEYSFAEHVLDETMPGEELKLKLKCYRLRLDPIIETVDEDRLILEFLNTWNLSSHYLHLSNSSSAR